MSKNAYWVMASPSASVTEKRLDASTEVWPEPAWMLDADVTGATSARVVTSVPVPESALTLNRTPGSASSCRSKEVAPSVTCRMLPAPKVAEPPDTKLRPVRSMLSPSTRLLMVVPAREVPSIFS